MNPLSTLAGESRLFDPAGLQYARTIPDARRTVAGALSPHRLSVIGAGEVDVHFRHAAAGALPVLLLRYGADVAIDPEPLAGHLLLQIVVSGRSEIDTGRETIVALPGDATIVETLAGCSFRWSADCEKIIIPVAHDALRSAIRAVTGDGAPEPTGFVRHIRLDAPDQCGTLDLIRYIVAQAASPRDTASLGTSLRDLLARHLVLHHSLPDRASAAAAAAPRPVRRAEAHMLANLEEDMCLETLASHACVSARTLCDAFQRHRGRSPLATLRGMRLDAVRHLLTSADPPSVTTAALQFRLSHPGRFAAAYRLRFGELPSETLRNSGRFDA